ncbi:MAG: hypothetical protein KIT84_05440 [Labilithrix sp.]|nr:hypothetical protein [Labilithrix sp.]MCW5810431.1 hypothetical protein [Labilithrix sp.]
MRPYALVPVALAAAACVGGGGALSQSLETQDRPPISNEGVSSSSEGVSVSNEGVSSTTESAGRNSVEGSPTGGFDCAGTYRCTSTSDGDSDSSSVVLTPAGSGGCSGDGAVLQADGTILANGRAIATWTSTGNGFTFTTQTTSGGQVRSVTVTCTKVSSSVDRPSRGDDDDDDDDSPPPPVTIIDGGAPSG